MMTVICLAVLTMFAYKLGVNIGKYKVLKAIEPCDMFPVMDKIADEMGKDEVEKRNMVRAMLRFMIEMLDRL